MRSEDEPGGRLSTRWSPAPHLTQSHRLLGDILLLAGLATLASGLALLQIAVTRVFAALYPYTLVFPLVAGATGGLGLGGFIAHRLVSAPERLRWMPALFGSLGGLVASGGVGFIFLTARLNALALNWLAVLLVFVCGGAAIGAALTLGASRAGAIFAAHLAGAALAAAAAVPLLGALGTEGAMLLPGALMGLAAFCLLLGSGILAPRWAAQPRARQDQEFQSRISEPDLEQSPHWRTPLIFAAALLMGLAALAAFVLSLASGGTRLDPAAVASAKSLYLSVQSPELRERPAYARWDAYARTDVTDPATTQAVKWLYMDGSGAALMYRADADLSGAAELRRDLGFLPFVHPGPAQKVLVMGAGGGQSIVLALLAGATDVTLVEANPGTVAALRHFADFNGGLLDRPGVRVVVDEARSFLRRTAENFDLIYLNLPAMLPEHGMAWALGEDFRLTSDAFGEYLRRLRPGGRVAIRLRDQVELTRAWTTAFTAVRRTGRSSLETVRHLLAVNDSPAAQRRQVAIVAPLLVVRNGAYSQEESAEVLRLLQQLGYEPLHLPYSEQPSPLTFLAVEEMTVEDLQANMPFNVRPPSDERPFFYEFDRGFAGRYVLAFVGAPVVAAVAAVVLRRRVADEQDLPAAPAATGAWPVEDEVPWRFVFYFAATGGGFGLVQVPLLLRLQPLIGHPTTTAAAIGAGLLGTAAVGSLLSQRFPPHLLRPVVGWGALAAGLLLIAEPELLAMVTQAFASAPLSSRIAAAALASAPLGVAAGVPFPAGIRLLAWAGRGHRAAQMWGISSSAAVAGAALSMLLSIRWGILWPWLVAAVLYLAVFLIAGLRQLDAAEAPGAGPAAAAAAESNQEAWRRPTGDRS